MSEYEVIVAPRAQRELSTIVSWWTENRPATTGLVLREFEDAVSHLATMPALGASYRLSRRPGVRRLLLPRSRYHVYYVINSERGEVRIMAVWHGQRGKGPRL